ncbi:FadR/GntR family transcriptional regulator [Neorhizobium galegae]|uniref:FadR/GntR family transcriptional regulator n=1 Tax=Neorhizobium galegae TaxID=399 RepID=UPI002104BAF4|nr:FadR/GntR family transcriptional regulator [Neorhizobium galegae]MCQ1839365.1 FadR family transcriptional regulator [Neorhizobium galegae]UIY31593.1 FadR family transcriptional regulator [Neorhizobium galegae]
MRDLVEQNAGNELVDLVGQSLVNQIAISLRRDIERGTVKPGDKLPSENELTRLHSVSRAVIREAVAVLRSEGVLEARKGVGVFVTDAERRGAPFSGLSLERISSVIELLELRAACETEAAGLAAGRRSAAQLETILDLHRKVGENLENGLSTRDADFALHMAIAEATQNRRFSELLRLIKPGIIMNRDLQPGRGQPDALPPNRHLQDEHGRIVHAIFAGKPAEARQAMQAHLEGSLSRYKTLLIERVSQPGPTHTELSD